MAVVVVGGAHMNGHDPSTFPVVVDIEEPVPWAELNACHGRLRACPPVERQCLVSEGDLEGVRMTWSNNFENENYLIYYQKSFSKQLPCLHHYA